MTKTRAWPAAVPAVFLWFALAAPAANFAHSRSHLTGAQTVGCSHSAPPASRGTGATAPSGSSPDPDLYCIDLLAAPFPELNGATGYARLGHVDSPFGASVSPEGVHRYSVSVIATGLPDPASLGAYTTYVAWATTPTLDPWIRIGTVGGNAPATAEVTLNRFMVLVSAETSDTVTARSGRIVLRGMSAGNRVLPLDDPVTLMGATSPPDDTGHGAHGAHVGHAAAPPPGHAVQLPAGAAVEWTGHPMYPDLFMPPGMMAFRPAVTPWLPGGSVIADAVPRRTVELRDGDTLRLEAGLVRRTIRGRTFTMYGYNGQYPGPLLHVREGATVHVELRNSLDMPTTVHWHGIRLDNRFDGVPDVTQEAVDAGSTYHYTVHFRDPGIYWYHPHVREDTQQALGLFGNIMVAAKDPDYYGPAHREEVLMLEDILIGDAGLVPFGRESPTHALMGRFGNLLLVNGEPDRRMQLRRGEVVRLFLTNVANTRTFNLSLPGARMKVVASDVGRFEREEWVENIVLAPAERYVVDIRFDTPGNAALVNRVQGLDHMAGAFVAVTDTLIRISVLAEAAAPDLNFEFGRLRAHADVTREIQRFRSHFAGPPHRELVLSMTARGLPFSVMAMMRADSAYFHPVEWENMMPMMNWVSSAREVEWILLDPATGRRNMEIDWRFRVGDVVRLRITNSRHSLHAMQHPIHIHGQRFLVLAQNGVRSENMVWKDTMLLPVGHVADILLELSNPGKWMLHCHIAEHMEAGMMMVFTVDQ